MGSASHQLKITVCAVATRNYCRKIIVHTLNTWMQDHWQFVSLPTCQNCKLQMMMWKEYMKRFFNDELHTVFVRYLHWNSTVYTWTVFPFIAKLFCDLPCISVIRNIRVTTVSSTRPFIAQSGSPLAAYIDRYHCKNKWTALTEYSCISLSQLFFIIAHFQQQSILPCNNLCAWKQTGNRTPLFYGNC